MSPAWAHGGLMVDPAGNGAKQGDATQHRSRQEHGRHSRGGQAPFPPHARQSCTPPPSLPAHDVMGLLHCGPACQSVAALAAARTGCRAVVVPGPPLAAARTGCGAVVVPGSPLAAARMGCGAVVVPGLPRNWGWPGEDSRGGHAPAHQKGRLGPCGRGAGPGADLYGPQTSTDTGP